MEQRNISFSFFP